MSEVYIMSNFKHLKKILNNCIKNMNDNCAIFCEKPDTDFSRNRKLTFESVIKNIICMENGALKDELLKFYDYSENTPTPSAFVQARSKIKVDAFSHLFNRFNNLTHKDKLYNGYRLLAIDGSELPIDNTIYDRETTLIRSGGNNKPYSAFHIIASYDLLECTYDDLIIQGRAKSDERDALCKMVDRYKNTKAIFIADRGYESYNAFEHIAQSGNYYVIRVRDIDSNTGMAKSLGPYPNKEFDIDVLRMLTLKQNKMIKACPQLYKFLPTNSRFDFMTKEDPFYEFNCRIVRFKISEDTYECIITNLNRKEFPTDEIKQLYNKRWGIETSFRELKYALGLNALHSKKRKLIQQEIYARIILYNLCQRVVQKIEISENKKAKYNYQINFTRSFHIIRSFLNQKEKGGMNPPVDSLIAKEILPIRPGRSNARYVKAKTVVCFNYRYD